MFDTVRLKCPKCSELVEIQTKSGSCSLNSYSIERAPPGVMEDVLGENTCYHCSEIFVVEMVQNPKYAVRTRRKPPKPLTF